MTGTQWSSLIKWLIVGGIALLLFFMVRACNVQGWFKSHQDTVTIRHDTTLYSIRDSLIYVPKPYAVTQYKPLPYSITDSFTSFQPVDTAAILHDYLASRFYIDTVFNSKYGYIVILDTISQNRIMKRTVDRNITIPTFTNTVTLTQPKKIIAYFGFEILGNAKSIVSGGGSSLGFKLRNDNYFGLKAFQYKKEPIIWGMEAKFPIRLTK